MTTITVNPDRSVRIETDTHLCILPQNPETMAPFASDEEAEAFARSIAGDPRYMVPKPAPAAPTFLTEVSPVAFLMMFNPMERVAIRVLRRKAEVEGDPLQEAAMIVDDWMKIVEDPRLTIVNLNLPQAQAGLDFLVAPCGILTAERAAQIKQGIPK